MNNKTQLARNLRKNSTKQELILWKLFRNHGINNLKFKRQYPIGNYIVDFVCKEKWLIIELDGGQHNEPNNISYDEERTEYLNNRGYRVLRFWNTDIDKNLKGVYEMILQAVQKCFVCLTYCSPLSLSLSVTFVTSFPLNGCCGREQSLKIIYTSPYGEGMNEKIQNG